jgi:hypothetical protein
MQHHLASFSLHRDYCSRGQDSLWEEGGWLISMETLLRLVQCNTRIYHMRGLHTDLPILACNLTAIYVRTHLFLSHTNIHQSERFHNRTSTASGPFHMQDSALRANLYILST